MKRITMLLLVLVLFSACQDEERSEIMQQPETEKVPDSIQTLEGEFIFVADGAVLRGQDFVYEVTVDSMARILAEEVNPHKEEDFDMVPVRVKGKITPNPKRDGWKERIEIREILEAPIGENNIENEEEE